MRNPLPTTDRLAELEGRVAALETETASRARRRPEVTRPLAARIAETREPETGLYPRHNSTTADQLPVVTLDGDNGGGPVAWSDRSEHPKITAFSPFGWLPPRTRVEIAWDGRQWRIIRAPGTLVGYSLTDIAGSSTDRCAHTATLGSGLVQIAKRENGQYVGQYYANGAKVLDLWENWCGEVVYQDDLVVANQDRDNAWLIETCCNCGDSISCPSESESESSSPSESESSSPSESESSSPSESESSSPSESESESSSPSESESDSPSESSPSSPSDSVPSSPSGSDESSPSDESSASGESSPSDESSAELPEGCQNCGEPTEAISCWLCLGGSWVLCVQGCGGTAYPPPWSCDGGLEGSVAEGSCY